jgi:hypothetical protein
MVFSQTEKVGLRFLPKTVLNFVGFSSGDMRGYETRNVFPDKKYLCP